MKKVFFFSMGLIGTSLFAQEASTPTSGSAGNIWVTVFGILFDGFVYIGLPLLLYCIGSYSLGLLDKHYHKKVSSGISWVPFARYYSLIKTITKSAKKAFIITLLPWIITLGSLISLVILGIIDYRFFPEVNSHMYTAMTILAVLTLIGFIAIIAMSFWRAFIISKYVKGDTTTAFGLSTYTALVLWYIALDRVYKKTDCIGVLGFIVLGIIICYYVIIFMTRGIDGIMASLGAQ